MDKKSFIGIGYWQSGLHKNSHPDIGRFIDKTIPQDLREQIAVYLDNGKRVINWLGHSSCRFGCGNELLGSSCLSDGDYIWPEGLSHYIRLHDIWLPSSFVQHALNNFGRDNSIVELTAWPDYTWWDTWKDGA